MVDQFQQGDFDDAWNKSCDDLWQVASIHSNRRGSIAHERTPLLSRIVAPSTERVSRWTESFWRRTLILHLLPVLIVLVWCSIPIPFDDCVTILCEYNPSNSPGLINFWFFLFWYFGVYNAIALFLITKLFSLYELRWWPQALGAKATFCLCWLASQTIGIAGHHNAAAFGKYTLSWVFLTFFTMAMPLCTSLLIIHRRRITQKQRLYSFPLVMELPQWRMPQSYRRFLWFCTALTIALLALLGGEAYAYLFLSTLPHTSLDAFVYVYSWVGAIYVMDAITDYVIHRKIRSQPLALVFKLYFFMIYFIFYRNLFARLRSVDQFAVVQLGSFLWVCLYYPIAMTETVHGLLVRLVGTTLTYEEYKRKLCRSFYLRNLAENTTMLGFLCWVNILHFGPNRAAYPHFHFDNQDGSPYTHNMTFVAALIIWSSELTSAYITRYTFRHFFHLSITEQAIRDFKRYPEMIVAYVLLMVHVLQNILLALIKLDFA